jgi:hypothetical protein
MAHPPLADKPARAVFITRMLDADHSRRMLLWLVVSFLLLCLVVAVAPSGPLMVAAVFALAFVPVGGFVVLSLLWQRRLVFEVNDEGLTVRTMRGFRKFSWVLPHTDHYDWTEITDYVEDTNLVIGRYGYLKVGVVRGPDRDPDDLWIMPNRQRERKYFDRFTEAFRRYVAELNLDDTPRAVAVATIQRKLSFFDTPAARVVAIALIVVCVGLFVFDLATRRKPDEEWRLLYVYLLLGPLTFYFWRRSFQNK